MRARVQGVLVGDIVTYVGRWKAQGAKAKDVVAQIVKHAERPLRMSFATPDRSGCKVSNEARNRCREGGRV